MARYDTISVTVIAISGKAIKITDGAQEEWIPKTLIEDAEDLILGEVTDISVQEWFLKEKGLL